MHYVYDILVNFNEYYYDFYEWEKKDNIIHVKKIPIIKIDKKDFQIVSSNEIKIDIKNIKNKVELWNNKKQDKTYLLLTSGSDILGLEFNSEGISIKRSSLIVEEELDVLDDTRKLEVSKLNYTIIKKIKFSLNTRQEIETKKIINKEIDKLLEHPNTNKINYLYYECFNKIEPNIEKSLQNIKNNLDKPHIYNTLSKIFNLIYTTNK